MYISHLNNLLLHESLVVAVQEEKRCTDLVVEHIREIQRRKSYLELGFGSLFDYLTKGLTYSESAAYRRIQAARLTMDIPEAASLNVTQASMLQTYFKKTSESDIQVKRELVTLACNKSQRELEKVLVERTPEIRMMKPDVVRPIANDTVEIRFTAKAEVQRKLDRLRGLMAHRLSHGNTGLGDLIEKMADTLIKQLDPTEIKRPTATPAPETQTAPVTVTASQTRTTTPISRYIPAQIKREIWSKARGQCQYCDPTSGRRCRSRYALQIDHLTPFSVNGNNTVTNLQLLCREHNLLKSDRNTR